MLYKRRNEDICVLAVSTDVLDLTGVIITDKNAASDYVSFRSVFNGLSYVNAELTFAEDWRDNDTIQYWRKKAAKCAEVLVPDRVDPAYILRAYVASPELKRKVDDFNTPLAVIVDRHLFFKQGETQ